MQTSKKEIKNLYAIRILSRNLSMPHLNSGNRGRKVFLADFSLKKIPLFFCLNELSIFKMSCVFIQLEKCLYKFPFLLRDITMDGKKYYHSIFEFWALNTDLAFGGILNA